LVAGGGNSLVFTGPASVDPIILNALSSSYFWDLSPNQINATIAGRVSAGQWMLSVKDACGGTSVGVALTIQ